MYNLLARYRRVLNKLVRTHPTPVSCMGPPLYHVGG